MPLTTTEYKSCKWKHDKQYTGDPANCAKTLWRFLTVLVPTLILFYYYSYAFSNFLLLTLPYTLYTTSLQAEQSWRHPHTILFFYNILYLLLCLCLCFNNKKRKLMQINILYIPESICSIWNSNSLSLSRLQWSVSPAVHISLPRMHCNNLWPSQGGTYVEAKFHQRCRPEDKLLPR